MMPDKDKGKGRSLPREEYEVAYFTKELGRPVQRKMLQRQLDNLHGDTIAGNHGEDQSPDTTAQPPPEDRAG